MRYCKTRVGKRKTLSGQPNRFILRMFVKQNARIFTRDNLLVDLVIGNGEPIVMKLFTQT